MDLLQRGGGGGWVDTPLAIGEAFLSDALQGPGGRIVAGGNRPRRDLTHTDVLFLVIGGDGAVREVPVTSSPVPRDSNASVRCLAGPVGAMIAIVEWGAGGLGVLAGTNGERWRGVGSPPELAGLSVAACGHDGQGFVIAGRDRSGRAAVATSSDGRRWRVESIDEAGAVVGMDAIDGRLHLTGWVTAPGGIGTDGAIWRRQGDAWTRLVDTGLEGDRFARFVEVSGLASDGEVVVAVGADRGRAGAWVATIDALADP